jgi:hypothetical protein
MKIGSFDLQISVRVSSCRYIANDSICEVSRGSEIVTALSMSVNITGWMHAE